MRGHPWLELNALCSNNTLNILEKLPCSHSQTHYTVDFKRAARSKQRDSTLQLKHELLKWRVQLCNLITGQCANVVHRTSPRTLLGIQAINYLNCTVSLIDYLVIFASSDMVLSMTFTYRQIQVSHSKCKLLCSLTQNY